MNGRATVRFAPPPIGVAHTRGAAWLRPCGASLAFLTPMSFPLQAREHPRVIQRLSEAAQRERLG